MSGRHGVEHVAQCVVCAALALVVCKTNINLTALAAEERCCARGQISASGVHNLGSWTDLSTRKLPLLCSRSEVLLEKAWSDKMARVRKCTGVPGS